MQREEGGLDLPGGTRMQAGCSGAEMEQLRGIFRNSLLQQISPRALIHPLISANPLGPFFSIRLTQILSHF